MVWLLCGIELIPSFFEFVEYNANRLGEEGAMGALLSLCGIGLNDIILVKVLKALETLASQSRK